MEDETDHVADASLICLQSTIPEIRDSQKFHCGGTKKICIESSSSQRQQKIRTRRWKSMDGHMGDRD